MWKLEESETNSVNMAGQTSDIQLRGEQADESLGNFSKRLDDATATESDLILASKVGSGDGGEASSLSTKSWTRVANMRARAVTGS